VRRVFIDGVPVCLSGAMTLSGGAGTSRKNDSLSTEVLKQSGILLTDLSLESFPSVTQILQQVNNVSFT
jgi:hypothetical protein